MYKFQGGYETMFEIFITAAIVSPILWAIYRLCHVDF